MTTEKTRVRRFIAFRRLSDRSRRRLGTRKRKLVLGVVEAVDQQIAYEIAEQVPEWKGNAICVCPFERAWESQRLEASQPGVRVI